jgi:hypothetical protein
MSSIETKAVLASQQPITLIALVSIDVMIPKEPRHYLRHLVNDINNEPLFLVTIAIGSLSIETTNSTVSIDVIPKVPRQVQLLSLLMTFSM